MKRLYKFLILLLSAGLYISCDNLKSNEILQEPVSAELFTGDRTTGSENSMRLLANNAAIEAAFTLDYRPQKAEAEDAAVVLSAAALSGAAAGSSGQGIVTGGGLRRLSEYKTVYFDPAAERSRIAAIMAAQEAGREGLLQNPSSESLTVVDWGPRGDYSSAIQRPSIYVIFSQPMIPLSSLGTPSADSPVMSISPPIKGTFRLYGTGFLSFEGDEPCRSQQVYTITVAANATSVYGEEISGERVFTFNTETLKIINLTPGEEFRKLTGFYFNNSNVPPEAAKKIGMEFNYPVQTADIVQYLEIWGADVIKRFTLKQENDYKITAELPDTVDFDTRVRVILKQGARSRSGSHGTESDQVFSFNTPGPFKVNWHSRTPGYGRYRNLVEIYFSYPLNEDSVRNAVSTNPFMSVSGENIEVWGSTLRVCNLPVSYGSRFRLMLAATVEDIYGRKLGENYICDIVVPDEPPPVGSVRFLDYGQAMLEAQFPPRFLFEYTNAAGGSFYQLGASSNPWITPYDIKRTNIFPGIANAKYFEEIDLSPHLNDKGKGFIAFRANLQLLTSERQRDDTYRTGTWTAENELNIQVTDLGMTVRYGFNKVAVMVTSLSTGKPVEGASVKLLPSAMVRTIYDLSFIQNFGETTTDKNGLAVLNLDASILRDNTVSANSWRGFDDPFVMVEKDGDRAIYSPSSHNNWFFGIQSAYPQRAEEITPVAFLFSDRGLYRPGEVLTYRGVDRSKVLGMYAIYQGNFSVILEEDIYNGQQVATIEGITSESGGFYGSINIPDDLKPGSYRLTYKRTDGLNNEIIANVPITVAFFERLKFQAALSAPAAPVIGGDDINLTLNASYLSGGSLSGATWESAWYEEMTTFRSSNADTRGFLFGPRRVWDSKRYVSSQSGTLSGQGSASITQKTGSARVVGAPYLYQTEARVTDISNQMVAAYRDVIVHPAGFYIGLSRNAGGFARAAEEMTFGYITVNTSGEKTSGSALFMQSGEDSMALNVELIREDWRRVQQRGVSGYVYDEYMPEQVVDSLQKITIRDGGGSIRVKPSSAGYHILRVSSKDREGRTALTEITFYVTGSGGYWNMGNPTEIRLSPDQEMYEPGDTAKILMQSTLPEGWYLVTVEREGIFTEEVRHFSEPVTVIDIPIARNYVPVVYVSVSSYSVRSGPPTHEYGSSDLDKPKGYFGVTRVNVNARARAFSVKVDSDKITYRPGEEVTMTLTATKDGRPLPNAELTLMAVDRGVLDLINYHVPDPISYFYNENRFPLSVNGGDSRAWLMDPVTYSVKNLAGGDAEDDSKIEERKDFNPTAVFEPMLITDSSGKVTCKFRLPDNLTTYRVTVFGVRGDLFALKESEIAAQNRINVREVIPRRLRERDTAEAGVLITNLDSGAHTLTVKLDIGAPLPNETSSGYLKIPGQAFVDGTVERRVTVRSGDNAVVYFDVAAVKEGTVTLNFTISSSILNERLIKEMVIEHPYVMETVTTTGSVTGDAASEGLVIPSFADNGVGSLSLTLDATRLSLMDSAVTWLFRYPYGCLEQRSAAIFPLAVFGEYLDSLGLKSEVSDPHLVVANELRYWAQLQMTNGGFPYWPSGTGADFYVSLRIAHIIAIAKSKNINVPSSLNLVSLVTYLNREYQEMQRLSSNSSSYYNQSYLQAYMLYVFSMLGERVDPSRLAEILRRDNADPSTLAFIGMTYRILGLSGDAANTAQRLRNLIRLTARGAEITDPLDRYRISYYGGNLEQLALALQFFADQYPGDDINTRLLYSLMEGKRADNGYWQSTAVTVRVLSAIDALIRAENLVNTDVSASVTIAGSELLSGMFRGLGAKPVTGTFDFTDNVLANIARDRMHPLNFSRRGTGSVYYSASLRYAIPSELQNSRDEGIGVFMAIYDINTGEEVKETALQSGKTYRARVRVSSGRDRSYLALRVPVPSGAEILDAAFVTTASYQDMGGADGDEAGSYRSWISHQVIMDNEVQYFWDRFTRGENTVSFLFRTARRGVYPTPPVQAECMYEAEVFGRTNGVIYTIE